MPLAVPQTSLQGTGTFPFQLLLDGNDLIRRTGTAPTVGVSVDSIELIEAGPGAVSSFRFMIEDPGTSAPLPVTGSTVLFNDLTNGVPLFRGTVNTWRVLPLGVGRNIMVECDGIEKMLDNIMVWYQSDPAIHPNLYQAVNEMAGAYLRADNITPDLVNVNGSLAKPLGKISPPSRLLQNVYVVTGVTFRQAVATFAAQAETLPVNQAAPNLTMDFYGGLRLWQPDEQPSDYTTLTITDTAAGARAAVKINYEVHPGDIVHEVYINGATGAVSGWYGDGTGVVGNQAYISDTTLDTVAKSRNAALGYLSGQALTVRGSFTLDPFSPATTVHAGGLVSITDTSLGLSAVTYIIQTIRKTFAAGSLSLQKWEVHFGGRRPSAMQELRNLTRTTLN